MIYQIQICSASIIWCLGKFLHHPQGPALKEKLVFTKGIFIASDLDVISLIVGSETCSEPIMVGRSTSQYFIEQFLC